MSDGEPEDRVTASPKIDIVVSIFLATVSIWLLIVTIPKNIGQAAGKNDISPSLFPTLAAWFLLGLSLSLITVHVVKLRSHGGNGSDQNIGWIAMEFIIWMLTATLLYFGLQTIGFLVVAAVTIALGALAAKYQNYWMICSLAVIIPLIMSQTAWLVFQVQLP
jgi:hypothetical protein|tara:strand:+ start:1186 stop:1674 length:489 start_codon:yes stop_codon:yes gene_type:complete